MAASRPPTITAVVPNSSARSSARWISSRVFASHQTGSFLARGGLECLEGRIERGLGAAVRLVIGFELLEMVGVEHGLAEVGDRAHQHARDRGSRRPVRSPGLRGAGTGPDRVWEWGRASGRAWADRRGRRRRMARLGGGARLTCSATGRETMTSRRGRPLKLTRALWPVAIAPAGAERKSVKPSRRRGSASGVGEIQGAGDLEFGRQAPAVIGRRRRQRRLGQVDRPALAGARTAPLRPAGPTVEYRSMNPG